MCRSVRSTDPCPQTEELTLSSTVHLHVGVAKTGTTFLQRVLYQNQALLSDHGVLYPGGRRPAQFYASLDLRGVGFKGHEYPEAAGAWQRLSDAVNGHQGSAVVSHETLARCNDEQIQRAVTSFDGAEVRVVVTARDLARQIPAVWQERLKNRSQQTYDDYLHEVLTSTRARQRRGDFWLPQWLPGVIERWAAAVGPERVTVVTVPPSGGDPRELWRRFATALELPDAPYNLRTDSANTSLGMVGAELLRRLNADFEQLPWPRYESHVKRRFAEYTLAGLDRGPRIVVPPHLHGEVVDISDQVVAAIETLEVRVVGDLADLRPRLDPEAEPVEVTADALLDLTSRLVVRSVVAPEKATASERSLLERVRTRLALRTRLRRLIRRVRRG